MGKHKYLGPSTVFSHGGKDYFQGDSVDIDDRTLELMGRHGHIFEGYNTQEGVPLVGYNITQTRTAPSIGNAPGVGGNIDIMKDPPARTDTERGADIQAAAEKEERAAAKRS